MLLPSAFTLANLVDFYSNSMQGYVIVIEWTAFLKLEIPWDI